MDDCALLPDVERSAGESFRAIGMADVADAEPGDVGFYPPLVEAGTLFVATDADDHPLGFAACRRIGDSLYVDELAVAFDHQRQGHGVALMTAARAWAVAAGLKRLALRTFRDVPFNRPFYEKLGFVEDDPESLSGLLATHRRNEAKQGLDVEARLTMVLVLRSFG